ncbi:MAG TPA: FGGY-family carbohydrate kinase, partial [Longimicrobiaceae bacterium]|nr:FGGY-family carbohydrate kinase [Longimicrobiaceae bacterium]
RSLREGEPSRVPETLWCYRLDRRRIVTGRALSNAGNAVAWLRETLRLPPALETEAALAALEPDAHGLTVLPLLLGERAPGWERWDGASLAGLTQATRPVEILRAWLEAVAYGIAGPLDALREALGGEVEVIASGGALHASSVWAGILADVLGCRVTLAAEREASSRGAALVALERLGVVADLADAPVPEGTEYAPDPARHRRYRVARERQRRVEEALAALAPHPAGADGGE